MALSLSIRIPSLSFYLTLHRPVIEWAQVAIPWSASIKGQLKQPQSPCRKKGMNKSKVTQGKTWRYLSAPAAC